MINTEVYVKVYKMREMTLSKIAVITLTVALLGACEQRPGDVLMVTADDFVRIATSVAREEDRVTASQLARWIAEERRNFTVVDIRLASEFEIGHVEQAINAPLPMLVSEQGQAQLPQGKTVVVYSNGNENAAKAVVMLRLAGVDARLLHGGYNYWGEFIVNPSADTEVVDEEELTFVERQALACSACAPGTVNSTYSPMVTPLDESGNSEAGGERKKRKKKSVADEGC